MIWTVAIFAIACITSVITFFRTPKIEIPKEIMIMEEEIEEWVRSRYVIPEERLSVCLPPSVIESTLFKELGTTKEKLYSYSPEIAPNIWIVGPRKEVNEFRIYLKVFEPRRTVYSKYPELRT